MIHHCQLINLAPIKVFSDSDAVDFVNRVFDGEITTDNLDESQYLKIALLLISFVEIGFGDNLDELDKESEEYEVLNGFINNVYIFAAAKSYQLVREILDIITIKTIKNKSEFIIQGTKIYNKYNVDYLTTECDSAEYQAKGAKSWINFKKGKKTKVEQEKFLRYLTKRDNKVRPEHALLDGIVKKIDDKFWDFYLPPNGWNCRCIVEKMESSGITSTDTEGLNLDKAVPDIFRFNAAKEKKVFSKKHPYFKVDKKDINLAKNNFNLPKP